MTIEIKKTTDTLTVEITGRLDTTTAPALESTVKDNVNGISALVIDLKGLEYISSAGLRVLLGAQKKMNQLGSMKVVNVCEDIMEIFEMTGFADILTIE